MKKVLVAMSGGVDSSVTALLLKQQGFDVQGITMHLSATKPPEESDVVRDAKSAADALGIPHHVALVADLFQRRVIDYFVQSYKLGETPNPCVRCNEWMKFGYLLSEADRLGCDSFSTGHYVRIQDGMIRRAKDTSKDQSYFLYPLYKIDMQRLVFPLGEYTKSDVRGIAREHTLPCATRNESQDICFIPDGSYADFMDSHSTELPVPGHIIDSAGNVLGTHEGIYKYTTGQRKGLGALGKKMFVKDICPIDNTIVVAEDHELFVEHIDVHSMIRSNKEFVAAGELLVQIRYRSAPVRCSIIVNREESCRVQFAQPVRAPSRGQSAVFYRGDCVIAGGIIT